MKKLAFLLFAFSSFSVMSAQCEGSHSAHEDDAWLSCQGTENPNPARSEEHWILYDFGDFYFLNESHFWNYNKAEETANGVSTFAIDYSEDGVTWQYWGDINLDEAPGSDFYYGEEGPDFNGLLASHLLLTAVSNYGGPCYGFSEMRLDVDPGVQGVEEASVQAFDFGLHPNPARDYVSIQLNGMQGADVFIYSPTGELVESISNSTLITRLNVSGFAPGLYMVEVVGQDRAKATKRLTVVN